MIKKEKVELLAPAGNPASFYGAVNAGADAVYLGGCNPVRPCVHNGGGPYGVHGGASFQPGFAYAPKGAEGRQARAS